MRLDPTTRKGSFLLQTLVRLLDLVLRVLSRTWRLEIVQGERVFAEVLRSGRPVIFCFWHNRIIPAAGLLLRRVLPAGMDLTLLASPSRDGELSTRFLRLHGSRVVRGSSSRGGSKALREILRNVKRHGSSPIVIPDGPKGPPYHFKEGVLGMAQITGVPILSLGFAADRSRTLGTWDRMVFPRPFSRVLITVEEPRSVPRGLTAEELARERVEIEKQLSVLTRRAEEAAGASDPLATPAPPG